MKEFIPFLDRVSGAEGHYDRSNKHLDWVQQQLASLEMRRRWQEAGCPQDLAQLCVDMGVDREDESIKPTPDLVVEGKP
jgi:hypothetical protein